MKKLFLLLMITAVVLTGCKKNETPQADQATGEIEFNITNLMDDGSRIDIPGIPDCDLQAVADYAVVAITDGTDPIPGSPFTMAISDIGDLMTDVLKLAPGTYFVTSFEVFTSDDLKIWAAPIAGSFYADFMNIPLNVEFTVVAYQKAGVEVEVLCYDETVADQFGFTWFDIDKVVLRDICLFGDICLTQFPGVTNWADGGYSGEFDMPAQFQVTLYRAGETTPLSVYQNYDPANTATYVDTWTVPMALCIQYPDALEIPNEPFELVLEVYQPNGNGGFALYEWYTFEWTDNAAFVDLAETTPNVALFGDDNVIDFYVGHCYNDDTPPDFAFPEEGPTNPVEVITANDLATDFTDPDLLTKWFYYNDETDVIDNSLGSFVAGPDTPPAGTGSSQVSVSGSERVCLATFQFGGVELADITTLAYSTYNPTAGNGGGAENAGFLNINVDFDGSDTWQQRLVYEPRNNGVVIQDAWQEWDAIDNGNSLWRWSGNLWGGPWPSGNLNPADGLASLNDIINAYPGVRILPAGPFVGIRVGNPDPSGYTENMDAFKFGTGSTFTTFDFEN